MLLNVKYFFENTISFVSLVDTIYQSTSEDFDATFKHNITVGNATSATFDDPRSLFGPAFNDQLAKTLEALQEIDAGYYEAATVQNIAFDVQLQGAPVRGIPVPSTLTECPRYF